jgi:hypothetical protein
VTYSVTPVVTGGAGAVTYALTGTDADDFAFDSVTGEVSMTGLDYDGPADGNQDNIYELTFTATDSETPANIVQQSWTVTVDNVIETSTLAIAAVASTRVDENLAYSVTPGVSGGAGAVTYALTGADVDEFSFNVATGEVSMTGLDHDAPADANEDNIYELTFSATDSETPANIVQHSWTVTVGNVVEVVVLSLAEIIDTTVNENSIYTSVAPTLTGTPIGGAVTYTLGGADALSFDIVPTTGVVSMVARDFEAPVDDTAGDGSSNTYALMITATDADDNQASEGWTVTVDDVTEVVELSLAAIGDTTVNENSVYTSVAPALTGTPIGGAVTYTLDGVDAADFSIVPATGVVSMMARDFESPADTNKDNAYVLTITATDADNNSASEPWIVTVLNVLESDADNDSIEDFIECPLGPPTCPDTDGDGNPDYQDTDSDGDGVPDSTEGLVDSDGDGIPDYVDFINTGSGSGDSDGDGILDIIECESYPSCANTDADSRPDYMETDSDNDGIPDAIEVNSSGIDTDSDGIDDRFDIDSYTPGVDAFDLNNDGIIDSHPLDSDGDGTPDYQDTDSDDDTILDVNEAGVDLTNPVDTDGDGVPDYQDTDSDADTILDVNEVGVDSTNPIDSDGDGIPDFVDTGDDFDNDGIPDSEECSVYLSGCPDSDGDSRPDYADIDSDDDTILDLDEAGGDLTNPIDTDGDGVPDYQDTDSDADGIDDSTEGTTDTDGDGIPDYVDAAGTGTGPGDSDGDGILDNIECDDASTTDVEESYPFCADTDADGTPDYMDTDSDNDGISDFIEARTSGTDSDGDGIDDHFDIDSYMPGVDALDQNGDGIIDTHPLDSDGDDVPDYQDSDSDNDGRADATEGTLDTDGDGIPDYVDADSAGSGSGDSDSDGAADIFECPVYLLGCPDTDSDGQPDYLDDTHQDGPLGDKDDDGVSNNIDSDDDGDGVDDSVDNCPLDANPKCGTIILISPAPDAKEVDIPVTLAWESVTDPDGGDVSYQVYLCEDQTFSTCTFFLIHSVAKVIDYASVEALLPLAFFGTVLGGIGLRRRKWLMLTIYSLVIVSLVSSCGGGGGGAPVSEGDPASADKISLSVNALKPGTKYYWKVVASDGINSVESSVQSFTTK